MRVKLVGGPFDGQEVETSDPANEIASDGGKYVATTTGERLTAPDGLRVVGSLMPVFEFVPDEEA